jgi:peptidoglycan-associated lipoprotein
MLSIPKLASIAAILAIAACSSTNTSDGPATEQVPSRTDGVGGFAPGSVQEFEQGVGGTVYFALDSYNLDAPAEQTLRAQAEWISSYNPSRVIVEGHADERGTREYNLALSERRANSARNYLISQGVPANILETIGYGKERPVSTCANESCYALNRRASSVIEK